jgi:hypothetical protein
MTPLYLSPRLRPDLTFIVVLQLDPVVIVIMGCHRRQPRSFQRHLFKLFICVWGGGRAGGRAEAQLPSNGRSDVGGDRCVRWMPPGGPGWVVGDAAVDSREQSPRHVVVVAAVVGHTLTVC